MSPRLRQILDALPLEPGMRVLEIGCGPGVLAREIARRIGHGHVLGIDRSPRAIALAIRGSQAEMATGRLRFREVAIEDFELEPGEPPYVTVRFRGRCRASGDRCSQLHDSQACQLTP